MFKKGKILLTLAATATFSLFALSGFTACSGNEAAHRHDYVDGACKACGKELKPSKGLEYTLGKEGTGYTVVGIGTCTDKDIVIPSTYEGLPVTRVGYEAFYNNDELKSVVIPGSIKFIGVRSFRECDGLSDVNICNGNGSMVIDDQAFYGCTALTEFFIPDCVNEICGYAFAECSALQSVVIGKGMKKIMTWAFENCIALKNVFYKGTETEWAAINNQDVSKVLQNAEHRYYYSETEPTGEGDYWHYAIDGVTIVTW